MYLLSQRPHLSLRGARLKLGASSSALNLDQIRAGFADLLVSRRRFCVCARKLALQRCHPRTQVCSSLFVPAQLSLQRSVLRKDLLHARSQLQAFVVPSGVGSCSSSASILLLELGSERILT